MSEARSRARVVVTGHVQGVFFRGSLRDRARSLGVAGWVRNNLDGSVEAALEGPAEPIEALIDWCHRGPRGAFVDDVRVMWEDPSDEQGFSVR
jgi:acylphosphatase